MEKIEQKQGLKKFDFDAGLLCLDFANTLDWHASDHPEEELNDYTDLVEWGIEAGLVPPDEAGRLLVFAKSDPRGAADWLKQAVELREALYRIFVSASVHHSLKGADPADLAILTDFWRKAAYAMKIVEEEGRLQWVWECRIDDPGRMLWPVVKSAVELLGSEQIERVGQCEDDRGCGFLFLDTSRNRSRRWCSMESCGNRAKAHRHYARSKKEVKLQQVNG